MAKIAHNYADKGAAERATKAAVPALRRNRCTFARGAVVLFVTGDPSVRPSRACVRPSALGSQQLVLFLADAAFVGGGEGSSVAVFRLGVLRYNHMTVGRKQPQKNSRCMIR